MKIAIDISQVVYGTGVSTYTENLVKNLLKTDPKNEYLIFGTSLRNFGKLEKLKKELSVYANVTFKLYRLPVRLFEFLFNTIRVFSINRILGEIDILHTSDWVEPKVNIYTKKVTTIHDAVPYLFPATLPKRILNNHLKRHRIIKKESSAIIVPSKTTKDDIIKFLGLREDFVTVIPEAVSAEFKPQPDDKTTEVLKKYKIKRPFVLSVSTQEPRKNIHSLLDAFEKLISERDDVNLVLVGKKGWGQMLEEIPNTIETGYISKNELIALYASCRVFVYPSLYEGFGLPILEAMACGAPVVTSHNSSMKEIAKDTAILIDPRSPDQIKKAVELVLNLKTEDYQKMVRASIDRARQFSWIKTAKETLSVYERVIKK